LYSDLLQVRRLHVVPHLKGQARSGTFELVGEGGLAIDWTLGDGARLHLRANFSDRDGVKVGAAPGERIYATEGAGTGEGLPRWAGLWSVEAAHA
jgi:1,4-alpha-glucan branching enzyme/maltooligosyltrehalose trehalohydrolase